MASRKTCRMCERSSATSGIRNAELQQRVTRARSEYCKLLKFTGLEGPLWIRRAWLDRRMGNLEARHFGDPGSRFELATSHPGLAYQPLRLSPASLGPAPPPLQVAGSLPGPRNVPLRVARSRLQVRVVRLRLRAVSMVRFHLPPVRVLLAAARFHLGPISPELSDISLPLAGVRGRLPPARASVPTVSRPLAGVRGRLPPGRASVPTMSRPLAAVRGRLPPAKASVRTVSGPLAGVRSRLLPVRASVPTVSRLLLAMRGPVPSGRALVTTMSRPVSSVRALLPTMPGVLSPNSGPLPGKRPFARRVFVLARGQNRAQRPRSTVRPAGPNIAQGVARRETSMCSGTRPDTVPRDGGRFV